MNATGHMLVAKIAWNNMTSAARAAVGKLAADPNNPVSGKATTQRDADSFTGATYMDDIRPTLKAMHFIDQPIGQDNQSLTTQQTPSPNSVSFFNNNVAILQSPSATQDQKAEAMRYVAHLTGDLHQPLHCMDKFDKEFPSGDRGGNSFVLSGHWKELHAVWDAGGGIFQRIPRPLTAAGSAQLESIANSIQSKFPSASFTVQQLNDLNPADWAAEGLARAGDVYTNVTEKQAPGPTYLATVQKDMQQEAALGGYRLANLYNGIFK